jgi:hypothetical protein
MSTRLYVGINLEGCVRHCEVFRCNAVPTSDTHGDKYDYCVGPFRTRKGAEYFVDNPYCGCVAEAEDTARRLSARV